MREVKKHPNLAGLKAVERAKTMGKMYRALSASEKAALKKRADATPSYRRKSKAATLRARASRKPRASTPYNQFVKQQMARHKGSLITRISAIAKLWRAKAKK